jgi:peroxiredoxin (alkyl hydroperoxide reductase subunit C)
MPKEKDGCVKPARGPILTTEPEGEKDQLTPIVEEAKKMLARVGKEAINFEANAYVTGEGFKPIKLSDYKGKWIVICFYPGDFTFV